MTGALVTYKRGDYVDAIANPPPDYQPKLFRGEITAKLGDYLYLMLACLRIDDEEEGHMTLLTPFYALVDLENIKGIVDPSEYTE